MRIAFVGYLPNTRLHAVPRAMLCHGDELAGLGHQVDHIFAPDVPLFLAPAPLRPLAFSLAVAPRLLRGHGGAPYEVVGAHSGSGWVFGMLRRFLTSGPTKYVLLSHGWEDLYWARRMNAVRIGVDRVTLRHRLRYRLIHLGQARLALRFADHMICCTEDERSYVLRRYGLPPSRATVVPLGVSGDYFVDPRRDGSRSARLLFVGQWSWTKGTHVLAKAFETLLRSHPEVRLSAVGTRVPAERVLGAFSEGCRSAIRVLPELDEESLQKEYQAHDILLLPSLSEGFGLSALEAMAAAMAVVASDVGGMKEWITNGADGVIVPSGDVDAFTKATLALLEDAEYRARLGTAARETARRYTWQRSAAGMLEVFQRLVSMPCRKESNTAQ